MAPKGAVLGANVFQGGPHKYGPEGAAESLLHIGKGEGAQAYGWGRYDAGNKDVAVDYYNSLSDKVFKFSDGEKRVPGVRGAGQLPVNTRNLVVSHVEGNLPDNAKGLIGDNRRVLTDAYDDFMVNGTPFEDALSTRLNKNLEGLKSDYEAATGPVTKERLLNLIEETERDNNLLVRAANASNVNYQRDGYLYKHDLPDEDIARYLDWDKPLSEQPESVRAALPKLLETINAGRAERFGPSGKLITEDQFMKMTGEDLLDHLAVTFKKSDQAASEALGKAGIPGLKYYDGMSRKPGASSLTTQSLDTRINSLKKDIASGGGQPDVMRRKLASLQAERARHEEANRTRNYVTWDQDVLDRMKLLERNGETFKATPGVPAMGLLSRDGDSASNSPTGLLGEPAGWNRQFLLRKMEDRKRMAMEEALQKNFRSGMSGGVI